MFRVINKISALSYSARFVVKNIMLSLKLKPFSRRDWNGFVIKGMEKTDFQAVIGLYESMSSARKIGWPKKIIYRFFGGRLVLLANDESGLIGASFFYFNNRDKVEGTIHQAFTGVAAQLRGAGIGSALKREAVKHFQECGLKGVSSRVSIDNVASLRFNEKLGFVPVEEYYDSALGVNRYYLVCYFDTTEMSDEV